MTVWWTGICPRAAKKAAATPVGKGWSGEHLFFRQARRLHFLRARPKRSLSSASGPEPNGFQSMKQSYERCLALARAEAQNGNTVAAENYYQHAEHFYRLMFTDLNHKWEL